MHFQGQKFSKQIVDLDGNTFDNCKFHHCQFRYKGTGDTMMQYCEIVKCDLTFAENAEQMIWFLQRLYQEGGVYGKGFVDKLIDHIKAGPQHRQQSSENPYGFVVNSENKK